VRVLVCGSRNWHDYDIILNTLADECIACSGNIEVVIEGECRGGDLLGKRAAQEMGIPILPFPADWAKYGKSAGIRRNAQMLVEGNPDSVLAFQINGSPGTGNMITIAADVGIPVKVYAPDGSWREVK
jgi:hypothetical protein